MESLKRHMNSEWTRPDAINQIQEFQIFLTNPNGTFVYFMKEQRFGLYCNMGWMGLIMLYMGLHIGLANQKDLHNILSYVTLLVLAILLINNLISMYFKTFLMSKNIFIFLFPFFIFILCA